LLSLQVVGGDVALWNGGGARGVEAGEEAVKRLFFSERFAARVFYIFPR